MTGKDSRMDQSVADPNEPLMAELTQAGAAVDMAIAQMLQRGLGPVSVASALLGGALCLMSKTLGDDAVLKLLRNAEAGVVAGDLHDRCGS
jgi:hypothetical protein